MDKVQKHNSFNTKYTVVRILQKWCIADVLDTLIVSIFMSLFVDYFLSFRLLNARWGQ